MSFQVTLFYCCNSINVVIVVVVFTVWKGKRSTEDVKMEGSQRCDSGPWSKCFIACILHKPFFTNIPGCVNITRCWFSQGLFRTFEHYSSTLQVLLEPVDEYLLASPPFMNIPSVRFVFKFLSNHGDCHNLSRCTVGVRWCFYCIHAANGAYRVMSRHTFGEIIVLGRFSNVVTPWSEMHTRNG